MADLVNNLGGPDGFGTNFLPPNDDGSSPAVDITSVFPTGINLFGTSYNTIYINNNGNVTFDGPLSQYTPSSIGAGYTSPIIAPYWADVDTRGGAVAPTGGGTAGSDLTWYSLDPATHTVTVTWDDVGYFYQGIDKTNAFQLQLTAEPDGSADIKFTYQTIAWTTGDASGGTDGLGGQPARIGYSGGDGVHYLEIPESNNQAALLNLPTTPGNTGIPGVFEFHSTAAGIYNFAAASVTTQTSTVGTLAFGTVHVGDLVSSALSVANVATPPAESLDATALTTSPGVTAQGTISLLAPGATDATSLVAGLQTATAAVVDGTVTVALASDGQGTSGAGTTSLPSQTIVVTGVVDNYAAPQILASAGDLTRSGTSITLDLGTVTPGSQPVQISLRNAAAGPADLLAGSFTLQPGAAGFVDTGFGTVSGIAANSQADVGTVAADPADAAGTYTETFTLTPTGSNDSGYSGSLVPETLTVIETLAPPCFAGGTRLRGPDGWVAVEDLREGDLLLTADGRAAPVRWIGRRAIDCARHPDPDSVRPVRIAANSFGPALPARDLLLSPEHAVFLDGALVPATLLVNDTAIARLPAARVTYFHVELDHHDILLAEDLPCESYLDTGNRGSFANGALATLYPAFGPGTTAAEPCAPLLLHGPALDAIRARLRTSDLLAA